MLLLLLLWRCHMQAGFRLAAAKQSGTGLRTRVTNHSDPRNRTLGQTIGTHLCLHMPAMPCRLLYGCTGCDVCCAVAQHTNCHRDQHPDMDGNRLGAGYDRIVSLPTAPGAAHKQRLVKPAVGKDRYCCAARPCEEHGRLKFS